MNINKNKNKTSHAKKKAWPTIDRSEPPGKWRRPGCSARTSAPDAECGCSDSCRCSGAFVEPQSIAGNPP